MPKKIVLKLVKSERILDWSYLSFHDVILPKTTCLIHAFSKNPFNISISYKLVKIFLPSWHLAMWYCWWIRLPMKWVNCNPTDDPTPVTSVTINHHDLEAASPTLPWNFFGWKTTLQTCRSPHFRIFETRDRSSQTIYKLLQLKRHIFFEVDSICKTRTCDHLGLPQDGKSSVLNYILFIEILQEFRMFRMFCGFMHAKRTKYMYMYRRTCI